MVQFGLKQQLWRMDASPRVTSQLSSAVRPSALLQSQQMQSSLNTAQLTHTFPVGASLSNCPATTQAFVFILSLSFSGACEPPSATVLKVLLRDYNSQTALDTSLEKS